MIHPFSTFRIYWEFAMLLFTIVALLVTPVFLAFYFDKFEKWYLYNLAIDAVFICDIVIWFFTGYYDSRTQLIVMDPTFAMSKYLRGFFIVDILPVLPLELFIVLFESLWYLASLNLLKILRMRTTIIYLSRLYHVYQINFHLYKIMEIGIIVIMCVHWTACLEYYLPLMVAKIAGQDDALVIEKVYIEICRSWIQSPYMAKRKTRRAIYISCVNRAIISLTGSKHYLNMLAPEDIAYNLILTIFGFLGFVYLLARFSQLTTTFHSTSKRHMKLIQQLYTRYKELSQPLQRQLTAYYQYRNKKGFETDKLIINHVSPYLREKLLLHKYQRLVKNVELFKHLPEVVLTQLIGTVRSEIFMTNDVLITAGTNGDALYFIASGTVAVYNIMGREMCHLEDGAYFGELSLVLEDEPRLVKIVAVENSEVYILSRVDFNRVLVPYPDLLNYLQEVTLVNLEQTPGLEKICEDRDSLLSVSGGVNISGIKAKRKD
ncbi:Potassium/sodium hyperpolarization-activated cyclic nucleotide-gated channel [Ooceraea biroi]|uniref:Potassium/sodium hyperpolarization-activated cyclic nucleotide-gated channel n=1 Tax=Ooceraea biroi TaxID=2015173 RepID=A0A026W5W6_OOCBI|nr:Potassium/sodium hyperpolarization-activated cyclic nucleotide-gated channel [Ooceraea biroi]